MHYLIKDASELTKKTLWTNLAFSFLPVDKDIIAKKIKNLNAKKVAPQEDITLKLLKLNNDIFSQYLSDF